MAHEENNGWRGLSLEENVAIDGLRLYLSSLEFSPRFLGFSFSLAFTWLTAFGGMASGGSPDNPSALIFWVSLSAFVSFLATALASRKLVCCARHRGISLAFGLLGAFGAGILVASSGKGVGLVVSGLLCGMSQAWLTVAWGEAFCALGSRRIGVHVLLAFLGSLAIYFVVESLPLSFSPLCLVPLLPLCALLSVNLGDRVSFVVGDAGQTGRRSFRSLMWRTMLAVGAFWFVFCMVNAMSNEATQQTVFERYREALLLSALMIAILLMVGATVLRRIYSATVYRIVLPMAAIGLTLLVVFGFEHSSTGLTFILAASMGLDMFYYVAAFDAARRAKVAPAWAVGLCRAVMAFCQFSAVGLSRFLVLLVGNGFELTLLLVPGICVIAVVSAVVTPLGDAKEQPIAGVEPPSSDEERRSSERAMLKFAQQYSVAVQRFGLTEREAEVLLYTMRGRSASYIADKLFIAQSTVKTHTVHLYQKMNVRDRQNMLDVIEALPVEGESDVCTEVA